MHKIIKYATMTNSTARTNFDDTSHQVEAIGTWDHGIEGADTVNCTADKAHKIDNFQDFLKCARNAIGYGLEQLKEKERSFNNILHDRKLREEYREHSEEIVAGEKMAVRAIVHEHSFDAPC